MPGALVQLELLKGGHATATVMSVYFEEYPRARLSIPGADEVVSVPIHLLPPRDVSEPTALEAAVVVGKALRRELSETAAVSAMSEKARGAVGRAQPLAKGAFETAREGAKQAQNFTVDLFGLEKSRNFDREPMRKLIVNEDEATDSRFHLSEEPSESRMPLLEQVVDSQAPPSDEVTGSQAPVSEAATTEPPLPPQEDAGAAMQFRDVAPEDGGKNPESKFAKADEQAQPPDFLE